MNAHRSLAATSLTLLISCCLPIAAAAQQTAESNPQTVWAKKAVTQFLKQPDHRVTITRLDGLNTYGTLISADENTFTLIESKTHKPVIFGYGDFAAITLGRVEPTKAQKLGRGMEYELTLPLRIVQCAFGGCC